MRQASPSSLTASQRACCSIYRTIHILLRGLPVADAHAHGTTPAPSGPPEECLTRRNDSRDHLIGPPVMIGGRRARAGIRKTHQALIDYWFPEHLRAGQRADSRNQGM